MSLEHSKAHLLVEKPVVGVPALDWYQSFWSELQSLVEKRGRGLAEEQTGGSKDVAEGIDQDIRLLIQRHASQLREDPALLQQSIAESLQLQDRAYAETVGREKVELVMRLQALELRAFELGQALANARGRAYDPGRVRDLQEETKRLYIGYEDLLSQFPTLRSAIERVRRDGERCGDRRYVEADRDAMSLHGSMRWYHANVGSAHRILMQREPVDRCSILRVFEERYGMSFVEWADRAFFSWRARLLSFFHFGALARAFSERWGVEVGIADVVREERQHGRSMRAGFIEALRSYVNEPHAQRTRALVNDNRIEFARCSLFVEINRGVSGFIALMELLQSLSKPERTQAMRALTPRQCAFLVRGAERIEDVIEARFPRVQANALLALSQGKELDAAVHLVPLLGTERRYVLELMLLFERIVEAGEGNVRDRYHAIMGEPLTSQGLRERGLAAPVVDWVMATVSGDEYGAGAARAHCACVGISSEWPGEIFYRFSAAADQEIIRRYEHQYQSSFWSDSLRRLRRPDEIKILRSFVERGTLTSAELVRHCLDGFGADFEGARECLRGKDARVQESIADEYRSKFSRYDFSFGRVWRATLRVAKTILRSEGRIGECVHQGVKVFWWSLRVPRDLDWDLAREFGGHQLFDLRLLRKGQPMTVLGAYDRLQERLTHERVRGLEWLFQRIDSNGVRWKRDRLLCEELAERIRNGHASEDDKKRLGVLIDLVYNGCDAFREAKLRLANVVVNVASIAGALYATSYLGAAPVISVMSGATLGAFTLRTVTRRLIQGLGYSRRDLQVDLVLSLIEGGTLLWGRTVMLFRLGSPYIDTAVRQLVGLVTKSFARHQVTSRWGRLHQAKRSRHVILLGELERQRDMSVSSSASTVNRGSTRDSNPEQSLRTLWEDALSLRLPA